MQRKDSAGAALPCSPPGPVSMLLPFSLSLSVFLACVSGSERERERERERGGRQRGNEENKDRRRETGCVHVFVYVWMPGHSFMITCSSITRHSARISHRTKELWQRRKIIGGRCWPIVCVSSNTVYCSQWREVTEYIYSSTVQVQIQGVSLVFGVMEYFHSNIHVWQL